MIQYIILILVAILLLILGNKENIKNSLLQYSNEKSNDNSPNPLEVHINANLIDNPIITKKDNSSIAIGNGSTGGINDCDTPQYLIDQECKSPNYLVEDETNFAKKQLLNLLLKINKKPIKLNSPCTYKFYNHTTMDDLLRRTMDEISSHVVTLINKESDYEFQKANYGDIQVWCDAKGNKEYKYELFLWSLKHYFQIKFYVHVVKFVKKNQMKPYCIESSPYIFPTYHNGYPCKDQLIPAPHEVIPTGNIVLSTKSVKPNSVESAEYMYLNHLDIENSTLVINANIQKDKQFIMDVGENGGIIDNKLEYTHLKPGQKANPIQPFARESNKWIETPDKPDYMGQYPCKVAPEMWDEDGIYYYSKARGKEMKESKRNYDVCIGVRSSTEPLPLQPNFWITNYAEAGTGVNCGPNSWLFNNYNGPMGTFVGGGKK
jgi:hypothetical protein